MKQTLFQTVLVLLLVTLAAGLAHGQFYEYVDKNGNTVYTDQPPDGADGRDKPLKGGGVFRGKEAAYADPAGGDSRAKARPSEDRKNYNRVSAVMYMTDWCGYCKKARNYIRSLGVDLVEYNVDKDRGRKDEMRRKSGGASGVPLIDIEGVIIHGYDPEAIKAALDSAAR